MILTPRRRVAIGGQLRCRRMPMVMQSTATAALLFSDDHRIRCLRISSLIAASSTTMSSNCKRYIVIINHRLLLHLICSFPAVPARAMETILNAPIHWPFPSISSNNKLNIYRILNGTLILILFCLAANKKKMNGMTITSWLIVAIQSIIKDKLRLHLTLNSSAQHQPADGQWFSMSREDVATTRCPSLAFLYLNSLQHITAYTVLYLLYWL